MQGGTYETWIKPREKKRDLWDDFKVLQDHYKGKGNTYVWIKEAEFLRNTLHHKNEKVISFKKFLTNIQSVFTGSEDNNEVLTKPTKNLTTIL